MLRIVDFARCCEKEWYEVIRLCINDETKIQPLLVLTHSELKSLNLTTMS